MCKITYFTIYDNDLLSLSKGLNFVNEKYWKIVDVNLINQGTADFL